MEMFFGIKPTGPTNLKLHLLLQNQFNKDTVISICMESENLLTCTDHYIGFVCLSDINFL